MHGFIDTGQQKTGHTGVNNMNDAPRNKTTRREENEDQKTGQKEEDC